MRKTDVCTVAFVWMSGDGTRDRTHKRDSTQLLSV